MYTESDQIATELVTDMNQAMLGKKKKKPRERERVDARAKYDPPTSLELHFWGRID